MILCVCIPILVTTFPEWLSGTEPLPHTHLVVFVVFCVHMHNFVGLISHRRRSVTLQSPTAALIPLFSSSELTGCGYPGLLDRKNRSDMCPGGSRTLDFLRARRAPYPLGQAFHHHTVAVTSLYIAPSLSLSKHFRPLTWMLS